MVERYIVFLFFIISRLFPVFADDVILISSSVKDHPNHDFFTEILTEAYSRLGYSLEIRSYPLSRSVIMANCGVVDGELFRGEFDQIKYPDLLKVPVPLEIGELSVFTKDLDFEVDGWESLRPYKIAIHNGLKPAEYGTIGMNVIKVNNIIQLLKLLKLDRIDLFVAPKDVVVKEIQDYGFENIRILTPPVYREVLYHYLHRDNQKLIPKLVDVLNTMQNEGYFNKVEP